MEQSISTASFCITGLLPQIAFKFIKFQLLEENGRIWFIGRGEEGWSKQ